MEQTKLGRFWDRAREAFSSPYARKAILNTASFLGGMLCSRGLVFGKFAPFGVAAVSSVPRGGAVGRGAGGFPGYLLPSPRCGACAVRGCHFGGDCHPVVPVGAERAEQSRAVRAYRHLFAPAADGDDLSAAQRLFKLHRGACMWRSPFWGRGAPTSCGGPPTCCWASPATASAAPALCTTAGTWRRWWPLWGWWCSPSLGLPLGACPWAGCYWCCWCSPAPGWAAWAAAP